MDCGIQFLRENNTGICKCGCGKTFGELIDHFIIGGDKTCLVASGNTVRIVAAADRKKHETTSDDTRDSITMFRTGASSGVTGPTICLVKSKG